MIATTPKEMNKDVVRIFCTSSRSTIREIKQNSSKLLKIYEDIIDGSTPYCALTHINYLTLVYLVYSVFLDDMLYVMVLKKDF